jgi:hypothetical protein
VLTRVGAVARARGSRPDSLDPHELRRRAVAALREVLLRIGTGRHLIVHLDDLQWGDVDSAVMLADLLLPPDPPRLLLVAGFRSEDRDSSPFLRTFLQPSRTAGDRRELRLGVLSPGEARDLACRIFQDAGQANQEAAEVIARISGGNPLFVQQAAQAILSGRRVATLDDVIWARVGDLPPEQRRLLEVVAVAGRPVRQAVALHAAGLEDQGRKHLIDLLAARLLRDGPAGQQEVETFHDRIRETVVGRLDPIVRTGHHRQLAFELQRQPNPDSEVLAFHLSESGDPAGAWPHYARAAEQAAATLAFDRAVRLYELALRLHAGERETERQLRVRLGDALANAGRGGEAAQHYLAAMEGAMAAEVAELQRKTADQFLRSGHMEEGLAMLDTVLRGVGLRIPATHRRAFLSGMLRRAWVAVRGLGFRERPASQVPAEQLRRIDVCSSAGLLSLTDPVRGMDLHYRHLLLALHSGEPYRVARALTSHIAWPVLFEGRGAEGRMQHVAQQATALARQFDDPYLHASIRTWTGVGALLLGQWRNSCELSDQAEHLLRERCPGVSWELATVHHFSLVALHCMGQLKEAARRLPTLLKEAEERGDAYARTSLLIHSCLLHLAADRPDRADEVLGQTIELCARHGYHLQRYHALIAEVLAALYRGEGRRAWQAINNFWNLVSRPLLLRLQHPFLWMHSVRAQGALGAARVLLGSPAGHKEAMGLLRSADRDARKIERADQPWSNALAMNVRAGLASCRGKADEAAARAADAEKRFQAVDMLLYAAAARRRRGQILGGAEGQSLVAAADEWMAGQDIKNPARTAAAYSAGFPD